MDGTPMTTTSFLDAEHEGRPWQSGLPNNHRRGCFAGFPGLDHTKQDMF
jgi:hypothetical protein